jgi:hypothetical protein
VAREHKNARANDGADAQRGEVHRAQHPFQALIGLGLGLQGGGGFASEKIHAQRFARLERLIAVSAGTSQANAVFFP